MVCNGFAAVYVPQIVANFLGYPPRITIAIYDCGQGEFAKVERDDIFGDDGIISSKPAPTYTAAHGALNNRNGFVQRRGFMTAISVFICSSMKLADSSPRAMFSTWDIGFPEAGMV
jgi:hypothetical protein